MKYKIYFLALMLLSGTVMAQDKSKPLTIAPDWTKDAPCPKNYLLRLGYRNIPEDPYNPNALCTRIGGAVYQTKWDWKYKHGRSLAAQTAHSK